jgi:hypothetical protein
MPLRNIGWVIAAFNGGFGIASNVHVELGLEYSGMRLTLRYGTQWSFFGFVYFGKGSESCRSGSRDWVQCYDGASRFERQSAGWDQIARRDYGSC